MCCLLEFIVKYVLFIVNLAFSLLGIAIMGLGIATLVTIQGLSDILPINMLGISMIVLGGVIFLVGFLACCGAVRESQWMLFTYAIAVGVLAGLKIWLAVVIFQGLANVQDTVDGWLETAFNDTGNMPAFHALELAFQCCGTTGPEAYSPEPLPPSCCALTEDVQCRPADAFLDGCSTMVTGWFSTFGGVVGGVIIFIVVVEIMAILFALFFCDAVRSKRKRIY